MFPLRALLFAVVLFAAQLAAGLHGLEHERRDGALPDHVCELCLAAQALGAGLPASLPVLPLADCSLPLVPTPLSGRTSLPPPPAAQGAPPLA